jgi:hypothetical protein
LTEVSEHRLAGPVTRIVEQIVDELERHANGFAEIGQEKLRAR